jgi:hypothetical protein
MEIRWMQLLITVLDIDERMNLIIKVYHYLYYCYYNLVSNKADHREDGASGLLTMFDASVLIAIYYANVIIEREIFVPAVEGFGIFFIGVLLARLNWIYFVKKKKYIDAVDDFRGVPKYITVLIGVMLLILPFALFVFSGIKMGNYIRSI